jgi:hypothetical protein
VVVAILWNFAHRLTPDLRCSRAIRPFSPGWTDRADGTDPSRRAQTPRRATSGERCRIGMPRMTNGYWCDARPAAYDETAAITPPRGKIWIDSLPFDEIGHPDFRARRG